MTTANVGTKIPPTQQGESYGIRKSLSARLRLASTKEKIPLPTKWSQEGKKKSEYDRGVRKIHAK
jgi:hypothetical protein